jgi:uncharacterized protein (TIGR03089 family)
MDTLWQAMMSVAQKRGPQPFVTWHGELGRIELSVTTYVNAVSKAANFLVEGLMLDEESTVRVELGTHWQSSVWLGALMVAGIQVTDSPFADVTIATKDWCADWSDDPEKIIVVTRDPFGMPDRDIDENFVNASAQVRMFGDYFSPSWPIDSTTVAIKSSASTHTWEQLSELANGLASGLYISDGTRYGIHGLGSLEQQVALQVVLPLQGNCSVVLIDHDFTGDEKALAQNEHISQIIRLGPTH